MDVAIYLLDNGAAIDEAVSPDQSTPLIISADNCQIDMTRMLLRRGASLDRFDNNGYDACFYCALPYRAENRRAATVDVLKVINGHISIDTNAIVSRRGVTLLHLMACYQSASEIDFLISLGSNVEVRDRHGRNALCFAAAAGNVATYFALLAHGFTTGYLEDNLLLVINAKANSSKRVTHDRVYGPQLFDPTLRDLLNRRTDLMTSVCFVDGQIQDIRGPAIPLQQAVAAYGPEIEAWFIGLLQECGRETEEDRRRLQELRMGGHGQHGMVIGEVQEALDDDKSNGDVGEQGQSSAQSEADDTEEEDESFWDAEEGA
jgi:hypothetical protein